ncbi:hypothetical protein BJX68DRAFT_269424 [Aspergillus pseudodeflectus]|uniref:Uncharacterized protein n=1 Tax=Aspergillus pseudodeflectus TaxID=176178 RepID=A0ABR4JXW6_9EURO
MRLPALWSLLLTPLMIAPLLAISDSATRILDQFSTVTAALEANQATIDRYQGGLIPAVSVGKQNYDTWCAMRGANSHIYHGDNQLNGEDSDAIVQQLVALSQKATRLMQTYQDKEPLLRRARASFMVPIVMQALYREADNMRITIAGQVPESHSASLQEMKITFDSSWNDAFDAYTMNLASDSEDYKPIFSLMEPFFKYFV